MRPNPGGILTGEAIVNREQEISIIWNTLENQSVVLSSERRVGKTCILRKMEESSRMYQFKYSILKEWWKVNRG